MADYTESSILIDAGAGGVADAIGDVEAYPEWTDQMRSARILAEDEAGWPDQVEFTVDAGILKDTYVLQYAWDLDEDGSGLVSWHLVRGQALTAMDGSYSLSAEGAATRVVYRLSIDSRISLPGIVKRKAEKAIIASALDGLKKRVEG
ncbi:MAG: SRPBCC family protein [Dermatophilaceae bacterium]